MRSAALHTYSSRKLLTSTGGAASPAGGNKAKKNKSVVASIAANATNLHLVADKFGRPCPSHFIAPRTDGSDVFKLVEGVKSVKFWTQ